MISHLRGIVRSVASIKGLSLLGGGLLSGVYYAVIHNRQHRMMNTYAAGNIQPTAKNNNQILYFSRPKLERKIEDVLKSSLKSDYYIIKGEVGCGKTRLIVETIRRLIDTDGVELKGAPIYVGVTRGSSFVNNLANAVNYYYSEDDEEANRLLKAFIHIDTLTALDEKTQLTKILREIERTSLIYVTKRKRSAVLVIDDVDSLLKQMPGALELLQMKAKLWADWSTVKVVFVIHDDETERLLQEDSGNWSRAAVPIYVRDLSKEEAKEFLLRRDDNLNNADDLTANNQETTNSKETEMQKKHDIWMNGKDAEECVRWVGGRMVHLVELKRKFSPKKQITTILKEMRIRERMKFSVVSRNPSLLKVVSTLKVAANQEMELSALIKETSANDVNALLKANIVRIRRNRRGTIVMFQSELTRWIAEDMYSSTTHSKAVTATS